jgi:hypothetical protein
MTRVILMAPTVYIYLYKGKTSTCFFTVRERSFKGRFKYFINMMGFFSQ